MKVHEYMDPNSISPAANLSFDRLSHAYITSGELTDSLAMAAVCSGRGGDKPCKKCSGCDKASRRIHPDITYIDKLPDRREILVEQIRRLKKDVIIVPSESDKKVYIISNADLMNVSAQNAFLRILEEPPGYAVFILNTEAPTSLLPTVRSRCVELKSKPGAEVPDTEATEMADRFLAAARQGNAAIAGFMFQLEKLDKEAFGRFLPAVMERAVMELRSNLQTTPSVPDTAVADIERTLRKAKEMLDLNVSAGHISGLICAAMIKVSEVSF